MNTPCFSSTQRITLFALPVLMWAGCTAWSGQALAAESAGTGHPPASQTRPAGVQGFTAAGLQRLDAFFADEIAKKRVPGAVVGIMRHGQLVHLKAYGAQNPETNEPMRTDSIFAVASMTKPMVAVGALTLTQQGKLPLFSRVDAYIPEVGQMKVEVIGANGKPELADQKRPMRVHDLMRHTSGLTYGGRPDTAGAAASRYPAGGELPSMSGTQEFVSRVTALPLVYQPGSTFEYSTSFEMLGAVIERVTEQRLGAYLKHAIWDPLGMKDTSFVVPASKASRIAEPFRIDPLTGQPYYLVLDVTRTMGNDSGGAGISTTADASRDRAGGAGEARRHARDHCPQDGHDHGAVDELE